MTWPLRESPGHTACDLSFDLLSYYSWVGSGNADRLTGLIPSLPGRKARCGVSFPVFLPGCRHETLSTARLEIRYTMNQSEQQSAHVTTTGWRDSDLRSFPLEKPENGELVWLFFPFLGGAGFQAVYRESLEDRYFELCKNRPEDDDCYIRLAGDGQLYHMVGRFTTRMAGRLRWSRNDQWQRLPVNFWWKMRDILH